MSQRGSLNEIGHRTIDPNGKENMTKEMVVQPRLLTKWEGKEIASVPAWS